MDLVTLIEKLQFFVQCRSGLSIDLISYRLTHQGKFEVSNVIM